MPATDQPRRSDATHVVAGVDVGGTFTDVVVTAPDGPIVTKVATDLTDQGRGVVAGLRAAGLDPDLVAHGTTTATNAVLERTTARTALVVTEGFVDVLRIARQNRPRLYDADAVRPDPLVADTDVVACAERIGADGDVVRELTDDAVAATVAAVAALDVEAVAICLLFSWRNPDHEERLAAALRDALDIVVTTSTQVHPELREYERASTTVISTALVPLMRRYLGGLTSKVAPAPVWVMTSAGGTAAAEAVAEEPAATLLSGPAGGVVAAAAVARAAGHEDVLALDMGGTSSDVCAIRDGAPDISTATEVGGLAVALPAVAIHTVGAGGGSIAWLDAGGALRVGPRSAGAHPGPAAYGHGGIAPTVTDAHVVLGHLAADTTLGSSGLRLDVDAARGVLGSLDIGSPEEAAAGVVAVVRATMARALRRVSTERGLDPAGMALVAYGGAGPLHAAALATELGCPAAIIPPTPGVLSALGLLLSPPRAEVSRSVVVTLDADASTGQELARVATILASEARDALATQGTAVEHTTLVADCRYAGQSHELRVDVADPADTEQIAAGFASAHERAYGYALPGEPVQVATLRAAALGAPTLGELPATWDLGRVLPEGSRSITLADGATADARVIARAALGTGDAVDGPAVITQPDTTTLLEAGDHAEVHTSGSLIITRRS